MGMCREAPLSIETMGHFDNGIYTTISMVLADVEKYQGGYGW
jgi:hypothetical protein